MEHLDLWCESLNTFKVDLLMPDFGVVGVHNMVEMWEFRRVVWQTVGQIQISLQSILYIYTRKPILSPRSSKTLYDVSTVDIPFLRSV